MRVERLFDRTEAGIQTMRESVTAHRELLALVDTLHTGYNPDPFVEHVIALSIQDWFCYEHWSTAGVSWRRLARALLEEYRAGHDSERCRACESVKFTEEP